MSPRINPRAAAHRKSTPSGTTPIHGLHELNVWLMKLGIVHQRVRPAISPAQQAPQSVLEVGMVIDGRYIEHFRSYQCESEGKPCVTRTRVRN